VKNTKKVIQNDDNFIVTHCSDHRNRKFYTLKLKGKFYFTYPYGYNNISILNFLTDQANATKIDTWIFKDKDILDKTLCMFLLMKK